MKEKGIQCVKTMDRMEQEKADQKNKYKKVSVIR